MTVDDTSHPHGVDTAADSSAVTLNDQEPSMGAWQVLRRGLATSPELRSGLTVTVVMALTAAAGRLLIPILMQQILDRGILGDEGYRPWFVAGASAVAFGVVVIVTVCSRVVLIRLTEMAERVLLSLRIKVFAHIHALGMAEHTDAKKGVLVSRVTSDIETLARFTQWGLISWITDVAVIVGCIAVMIAYSGVLTMVVVAIHLPLVPLLRWVQRRQFVAYSLVRTRVGETLGRTSEAVVGAPVIRAYGYDGAVRARLDESIDRQYRQQLRSQIWFAGLLPVVDFVSSISLAVTVGVGVWWRNDLGLEIGGLVAFVLLVNVLLNPITQLGEVLDQTQTALAGWSKILRVFDVPVDPAEPDHPVELAPGPLSAEFDRVSFSYRAGPPVLCDVSLMIPAESKVIIVGETGSGKTTVARLLTRLADPSAGVVRIGGVDLRTIGSGDRRRAIRMVPQDGFLFDTTIRANIGFGRSDSKPADADRAINQLGLREWVDALPYGLETLVGERGSRLSVGERQLVALARAQLADPGLLILDEATSAVDPETEKAMVSALERLSEGRTTISIAHRLSGAAAADLVLVFDRGRLVQQGHHSELVSVEGRYRSLYESWIGNTRHAQSS